MFLKWWALALLERQLGTEQSKHNATVTLPPLKNIKVHNLTLYVKKIYTHAINVFCGVENEEEESSVLV